MLRTIKKHSYKKQLLRKTSSNFTPVIPLTQKHTDLNILSNSNDS